MKSTLMALCMACGLATGYAQEKPTVDIAAETRVGYNRESIDGDAVHSNNGIKGNYLNLKINGSINSSFSYSWRHRLNKKISDGSFFDATDWIYLNYKANKHWSMAAGKQVVLIGGYEYDRAPIDVFLSSEYWNNIPCYQFGGSVTYSTAQGNDQLTAQFCESPFRNPELNDLYAYNLYWMGKHGVWSTLYSLNMMEYVPDRFISYIALGNQWTLGNTRLQLDFMNRAADHQTYFLRDCSVMAEIACQCHPNWELYAKTTYDVNRTKVAADLCVLPGTELTSVGGGIHFYPLKDQKNNVRVHACAAYAWGTNGNPGGTMKDKQLTINVGLTWKMHLLSFGK